MNNTNWIKFWEIFVNTNLYKKLRYKAQTDLMFNVVFIEFISDLNDAKTTTHQTPEIVRIQKNLDIMFLTCSVSETEKIELETALDQSGLSSLIYTRDEDYVTTHNYNYQNNTIIVPQPHLSWILDENDVWQPPIPCPGSEFPIWDEELYQSDNTKGWVLTTP